MTFKIFLGLAVALCLFLSTQGLSLRQRRQAQVEAEAEAEARPCMDDEGGKYIEREFEGSCYTVVIKGMSKRGIPRRTSYARAAQVCQNSFDGGLARIESTAERDFVFNQLATTTNLSWVDGQFDNGVWNYFQYDDALQTQQLSTDMLNEESGQEGEALVLDNRCRLRGLDRTRTIGYICERSLAVEEQTTPAMSEQEEEEEVAELMEETEDDRDAAEDGNGTEVDASQGEVAAFFANANALEGEETTPEAEEVTPEPTEPTTTTTSTTTTTTTTTTPTTTTTTTTPPPPTLAELKKACVDSSSRYGRLLSRYLPSSRNTRLSWLYRGMFSRLQSAFKRSKGPCPAYFRAYIN